MINGEMFIAAVGLGGIVMNAGRRFDAETVLAVLIVTVVTALLVSLAVQSVDRRVNNWLPSVERGPR